jgi:tetratricopeptide (TPR) repeat protein
MDVKTSESHTIVSETTTNTVSLNVNHQQKRIIQNYSVIWMDEKIDQSNKDYQNTLAQLRHVANSVNVFTERDQCVDFLTELEDLKVFLIADGVLSQQIMPLIHDIPQLDTIYIYCGDKSRHEKWTKNWAKIRVHTEIKSLCEALQLAAKRCNEDYMAISFVSASEGTSAQNLDQLEPSFMYTQIFKEILLDMEHDTKSINRLVAFYRKLFNGNISQLAIIDEFEHDYRPQSSIWWYTRTSFTFEMLNQALRMLEGDIIINMGFFIRDLHCQIEQLHKKQVGTYQAKSFLVYRGQGLSITDFEKLKKTKGGLMSFNNFLSTSTKREVSLLFAEGALGKLDSVGILFEIIIDPAISSAIFASIEEVSYFQTEAEILFSMHTVFRIGEITKIDKNSSLYQVELKLTSDDDEQLRFLTQSIREESGGGTGWQRMGTLLLNIGQFDKAEDLFKVLLEETSNEGEKVYYYSHIGYGKHGKGDFKKSISYYEKALEIEQKTLPPNHPDLATSYNNIGLVYDNMGEYSKALLFYEKALKILQKNLPSNHPHLATSYNNIGLVSKSTGEYSKALSFYEKALEIRQKTLPPNHPDLAQSYNNISAVYHCMGEYSKALSFHEKALEIRQKTLPGNHPDLATSYGNIGGVYYNMGEYSKALSFYEKALEIRQKTLPPNHPDLATSYNNIGLVSKSTGEYSKALSFYEKALEIEQKTLPPNHPDLATSYNNIGGVYYNMGEYSKALSFYEKALESWQKTLPPNHPNLAISYNNIGGVYNTMGEYSKALSFHEKALEIRQKTLPPNHPDLAQSYNNISAVYYCMGEYSKALSFYERALNIFKSSLPANHPSIKTVQENIEVLKRRN